MRFLDGMPPREFAWRIAWIMVRLALALALMGAGHYFYYQGF